MSIDDRPRHTRQGPRPRQVKLSGCALRHTAEECDCIRGEQTQYLCHHCNGCGEIRTDVQCPDCRGWGALYSGGAPIHPYSFLGATNNADSVADHVATREPREDPDDPWATAGTVLDADPWTDPGSYEPPF